MSSLSADVEAQKDAFNVQAVSNFRNYLRIPSVHPDVNYDDCIKFLQNQANELSLSLQIHYMVEKKPIIILTWIGKQPNLPSILLNSHMDVVPVFEDKWTFKPFDAHVQDNKIYARGTQDMKCVGIQYLEAIRRLKGLGIRLIRTIHVSFVPDEEIGGVDGMRKFVHTKEFQNLNVGFALDEGMASENNDFVLFNGERSIWHLHIHCRGTPGHGSLLLDNTAGEKVQYLLNKFFEFRRNEKQKLIANPNLTIGDVTTINLTQLKGGVQSNVVPPQLTIVIDCRVPVTVDMKEWELTINKWCKEAGDNITIEYEQKQPQIEPTKLDKTNPYWIAFKKATDQLGLQLKPEIFPGGTDSRYVRSVGLPAIGFSPINNTPILLHDHDEFLSIPVFLKGIEIYCKIIQEIANLQ